ncbi:MAG TPA: DUF933 domain-containing protein [Candidatus Saccharimonadales bacterium]|nr:DUF933 domain-containing protein [Candidatus Saccharimonadales bacterium]
MIRVGLVGLPNAGKSTLFNFLTGALALVAPYPFSTVTPNKANLKLYDKDADALAAAVHAPDVLRTEVEVWDIAGLIAKASEGEGLGNEFLGQIKDCQLLVHVLRADKTSTAGSIQADSATVLTEIALFDHKCLLKPFEKGRRLARLYPHDTAYARTNAVLSKAYYGTKEGQTVRAVLDPEDLAAVADLGLISDKPRITLLNCGSAPDPSVGKLGDLTGNLLELATLVTMTEEDRAFLGYSSQPLYQFLQAYTEQLLAKTNSKRFYTVGHLGVGQWLVPRDADAAACSQLVHAELGNAVKGVKVATLADFIHHGSWPTLTKQGAAKKYGPSYVPADRAVLYFEAT